MKIFSRTIIYNVKNLILFLCSRITSNFQQWHIELSLNLQTSVSGLCFRDFHSWRNARDKDLRCARLGNKKIKILKFHSTAIRQRVFVRIVVNMQTSCGYCISTKHESFFTGNSSWRNEISAWKLVLRIRNFDLRFGEIAKIIAICSMIFSITKDILGKTNKGFLLEKIFL